MRDATGELSEALQPLRLLQPGVHPLLDGERLQPFAVGLGGQPLGDVTDGGHHERSVVGVDGGEADVRGEDRAVPAQCRQLPAGAHRSRPRIGEIGAAVRGMPLPSRLGYEHVHAASEQLLAGVPEHVLGLGVHQHDRAVPVDDDHGVRCGVQQRHEAGFGPFPVAEIPAHRRDAGDPAVPVEDRRQRERDGYRAPVAVQPVGAAPLGPLPPGHLLDELLLGGLAPGRPHGTHVPSDDLVGPVPEKVLGAGVPAGDHPVEGHAPDRVMGRAHDRREERLRLGPLAHPHHPGLRLSVRARLGGYFGRK